MYHGNVSSVKLRVLFFIPEGGGRLRSPIFLHGLPAHTSYSGIFFVTTDAMPTTECAPIVTPSTIETFAPIHTSSPMCTPSDFTFCERMSVSDSSKLWLKAKIEVDGPIRRIAPYPRWVLPCDSAD